MRARVAIPFVVTLSSAACAKTAEQPPPITKDKPTATPTASEAKAPPASSGPLVYDGYGSCYSLVDGEKKYVPQCPEHLLPEAKPETLVYKYGGYCRRAGDGQPVQCPKDGPNVVLPEPSSIKTATGSIFLQYGSLKCFTSVNEHCPPKVACNPPPPEPIACPASLMPKLVAGTKPTKKDGNRCFFGTVEVACP